MLRQDALFKKFQALFASCALLCSIVVINCTRSSSSKPQSRIETLTVKGRVLDQNGASLAGAAIYVGHKETPVAATSPDGSFLLTLDETSKLDGSIANASSDSSPSFLIYFIRSDMKMAALSPPINFAQVGDLDLGVLVAKATSSYQGRVVTADSNQNLTLAASSQVFLGPFKSSTDESGFFRFDNVPVGSLPLKILSPIPGMESGYSSQIKLVTVNPPSSQPSGNDSADKDLQGELLTPETIVIFQNAGPSGIVIPDLTNVSLQGGQGSSTKRIFRVYPNSAARLIRYHHDRRVLESLPPTPGKDVTVVDSPSAWRPILSTMTYDFPADGGQALYYQFADLNKSVASEIYKSELEIDLFSDSSGFKVEDGVKAVKKSSVVLDIDLPRLAVAMRISPDLRALASAPWQRTGKKYTYTFENRARDVPGSDLANREIYIQFRDAFGRESKMFRQDITLEIFKGFDFVVGDGTGVIRSRNVELNFNLTEDISGIRIAETREALQRAFWQSPESMLTFSLAVRQDQATGFFLLGGRRELCVQANSSGNIESPVICKGFEVELFNQQEAQFIVNDGNRLSTSRLVKVNIQIPSNAYEMRIFENGPDTTSTADTVVLFPGAGLARSTNAERAWMVPVTETFYVFNTVGSRVLYLQFRSIDGIVSSIYQQSLVILPIAEAYANTRIRLNSGNPLTLFPIIGLTIENLPITATAMIVSVNTPPNPLNLGAWQDIEPYVEIPIASPGPKTVYVLFRNSDREISPSFVALIEFQPFPNQSMGLVVNGGANLTFVPEANVVITAPPTAYEMRFACENEDITLKPYSPFQPNFQCSLGNQYSTTKRVRVQFRTQNRLDESPVLLSQLIEYREAFPLSQLGLLINNGDVSTTNPQVNLTIDAPVPPTQLMRISHISTSDLQAQTWVPYNRNVIYNLPANLGIYTVYVQVSDGGNNNSSIFSRNIELK